MVCLPKEVGGLGVIRLKMQNVSLVMKNLHNFYNKADIPWVKLAWEKYYATGRLPSQANKGSFWWRDILRLLTSYKGIASAVVFQGDTCLHWHDFWNNCVLV